MTNLFYSIFKLAFRHHCQNLFCAYTVINHEILIFFITHITHSCNDRSFLFFMSSPFLYRWKPCSFFAEITFIACTLHTIILMMTLMPTQISNTHYIPYSVSPRRNRKECHCSTPPKSMSLTPSYISKFCRRTLDFALLLINLLDTYRRYNITVDDIYIPSYCCSASNWLCLISFQ